LSNFTASNAWNVVGTKLIHYPTNVQ